MRHNTVFHRALLVLLILLISACTLFEDQKKNSTSTVLSKDGSPIAYDVQGQGDTTLVFVHCWTCNHHFWDAQIEHFSKKYKVIWLDLAAHGLSGSNRTTYTMTAFGEDVAEVVNSVGGNRVILIGHSMGGPVSIEAAKILGDKVVAIVGVDTFYTPFNYPKTEAEIEALTGPFKKDFTANSQKMVQSMFSTKVDPKLKASIIQQFSGKKPEMGISALYEILRWNIQNVQTTPSVLESYSQKLRNINAAPTGKEQAMHDGVTIIADVGHFIPQVKPDEFNATLSKIIAEFQ